jgi:F0F1-type ATP synthase assembly protein I
MPNQPWLSELQRELSRRKLPRREIARLVAELSDHLADMMESQQASGRTPEAAAVSYLPSDSLKEDHMSKDANVTERLGSPSLVAESALREYRQRSSVLSRSRLAAFCTFVLSPLPALCLAWIVSMTAIVALGSVWKVFIPDPTDRSQITPQLEAIGEAIVIAYVMVPAILVSVFYGRLARKTPNPWRWGLAACLLVALGTMLVHTQFEVKHSNLPGKNQVMFGVGFGTGFLKASRLVQFALPFAAGLLMLRRSARSTPSPDELPRSQSGDAPDECGAARAA